MNGRYCFCGNLCKVFLVSRDIVLLSARRRKGCSCQSGLAWWESGWRLGGSQLCNCKNTRVSLGNEERSSNDSPVSGWDMPDAIRSIREMMVWWRKLGAETWGLVMLLLFDREGVEVGSDSLHLSSVELAKELVLGRVHRLVRGLLVWV